MAIDTEGVSVTAIVKALLVAVVEVTHGALLVKTHVIISLFANVVDV